MVDSTSATLIRDSVGAINAAFHSTVGTHTTPAATNDYGVPQLFEDAFEDEREVAKIPLLASISAQELSNSHGKLVRCHCYVIHSDSEIFGGAFRNNGRWQLGRYGLDASVTLPVSDADLLFEERTSLRCRPLHLPGIGDIESTLGGLSLHDGGARTQDPRSDFMVKLYNEKEEGLLHACLDIIGILEVADSEVALHSIITKNQRLSSMITSIPVPTSSPDFSEIRADLLQKFDEALEGDSLASELVLLSLISGVAVRSPLLVGPLILNLRGISPDTAESVTELMSDLTCTLPFSLSIENLNKSKLYPSHDGELYEPGALQLPADYAVLLNESALSEGNLNSSGVKNLQALRETIDTQQLTFHFPFSEFQIPVDLSFIILSHGKSLLPSTISIPLERSSSWNLRSKSSIQDMRHYLARCKLQEIEISDSVSTEIQEDFVKSRKQGHSFDQTDLSMALALGKEVAKSHGRRNMIWEDYEHARSLRERNLKRDSVKSSS